MSLAGTQRAWSPLFGIGHLVFESTNEHRGWCFCFDGDDGRRVRWTAVRLGIGREDQQEKWERRCSTESVVEFVCRSKDSPITDTERLWQRHDLVDGQVLFFHLGGYAPGTEPEPEDPQLEMPGGAT